MKDRVGLGDVHHSAFDKKGRVPTATWPKPIPPDSRRSEFARLGLALSVLPRHFGWNGKPNELGSPSRTRRGCPSADEPGSADPDRGCRRAHPDDEDLAVGEVGKGPIVLEPDVGDVRQGRKAEDGRREV